MFSKNRKFWNLSRTETERPLSNSEFARLAGYRLDRPELADAERAEKEVLSFIRDHAAEPEPSAIFNSVVIRRWRQQRIKRGVSYWSPALLGAGIAALAVLAILQMLNSPANPVNISNHEAKRVATPTLVFPTPDFAENPAKR